MTVKSPNILLIQADQCKPQVLGAYGGAALTPRIDALADTGVLFERAYCNFPLCAPSRFSLLSGHLASRIGAYDNAAEFPAQVPTIAHYLRLAGYRTCLSGKQHFVGPDMLHGFDERLTPELYPTDFSWTPSWQEHRMESNNDSSGVTKAGVCTRSLQLDHDEAVLSRAIAKLHDFARNKNQPFFLNASFTHPHEPYYCLQQYWDRYRHDDISLPEVGLQPEGQRLPHTQRMLEHHGMLDGKVTPEHVRVARHAYLANVSYVDDLVGRLLDTLELAGLADNTIVMFTADHGDMLGEHGMWFKKHFFDECLRVPLIVNVPSNWAGARVSDNVSLVDVLPTLCDLAGVDTSTVAPSALDGESLVSLFDDPNKTMDRAVFAEITSEGVPAPMFMTKRGTLKLLSGGGAPDALFDTATDANECNDRSLDASLSEQLARLREDATSNWDSEALHDQILVSQRQRRLVNRAHQTGLPPRWDVASTDTLRSAVLRSPGNYNDWAWTGIE